MECTRRPGHSGQFQERCVGASVRPFRSIAAASAAPSPSAPARVVRSGVSARSGSPGRPCPGMPTWSALDGLVRPVARSAASSIRRSRGGGPGHCSREIAARPLERTRRWRSLESQITNTCLPRRSAARRKTVSGTRARNGSLSRSPSNASTPASVRERSSINAGSDAPQSAAHGVVSSIRQVGASSRCRLLCPRAWWRGEGRSPRITGAAAVVVAINRVQREVLQIASRRTQGGQGNHGAVAARPRGGPLAERAAVGLAARVAAGGGRRGQCAAALWR